MKQMLRYYCKPAESESKEMNIYDIAKLSGVSIATVSRVVNGRKCEAMRLP